MSLPTRRGADTMPRAISSKVVELPAQLRRSLTWCGDGEIADHAGFKVAIAVAAHVCDQVQHGRMERTARRAHCSIIPYRATADP